MFNLFNRPTSAEAEARAYCRSIGADPDEIVWGPGRQVRQPRWILYVSQGAADRTPVYSKGV